MKFYSNHGKFQQAKKNRSWKVVLIIVLAVVLLMAAVFCFIWQKLDLIQFDNEVDKSAYATKPSETTPTETGAEEENTVNTEGLETVEKPYEIPDTELISNKEVLNILLIGTDERTNEFNVDARSDAMILASINRKQNTIKLVSLERGIAAPILDGVYKGKYDWLTNIFRYGGADLLVETVEEMFKVDIDNYIRVNFCTVTTVVDAIGGIEIELTKPEAQFLRMYQGVYQSTKTQAPIVEGVNTLDGGMALGYARLRAIDDDWFRIARQRKVVIATAQKLKGSSLKELNEFANQVLPLIQTDLTKLEIADLMLYAPQILGASFDQTTIPQPGHYGGMSIMGENRGGFAVKYELNNPYLHEFLYGSEEDQGERG